MNLANDLKFYHVDKAGNATMKNLLYYCPICYRTVLQPVISTYQVNNTCYHDGEIISMKLANC